MKKLLTLLLCFAAVSAFAEINQVQKDVEKALKQATTEQQAFEKSLQATVTVIYQTRDEAIEYGTGRDIVVYTDHIATCSAVIYNEKGDLAIDKACEKAIFNPSHQTVLRFHADLKNLGRYYGYGDYFFYDTPNVSANLFTKKGNYITFPLTLKPTSQVKEKLTRLFAAQNQTALPEQTIVHLLKKMPKMSTSQQIVHY